MLNLDKTLVDGRGAAGDIIEDIQPRCIVCKKPIDPEIKYSNMLLETTSGTSYESPKVQ